MLIVCAAVCAKPFSQQLDITATGRIHSPQPFLRCLHGSATQKAASSEFSNFSYESFLMCYLHIPQDAWLLTAVPQCCSGLVLQALSLSFSWVIRLLLLQVHFIMIISVVSASQIWHHKH